MSENRPLWRRAWAVITNFSTLVTLWQLGGAVVLGVLVAVLTAVYRNLWWAIPLGLFTTLVALVLLERFYRPRVWVGTDEPKKPRAGDLWVHADDVPTRQVGSVVRRSKSLGDEHGEVTIREETSLHQDVTVKPDTVQTRTEIPPPESGS